jgi:serine/threonine-protein kinase RIO1
VQNLVRFFGRHGVDAKAEDVTGRLVHERKQERERAPSRRQGYGTRRDEEE